MQLGEGAELDGVTDGLRTGALDLVPVTPNERIALLTEWLEAQALPPGIAWEWTGDQEDQAESEAFLGQAFGAALGLMFIILLAQFNSLYNATLVLLAVVLSTTGVLIGMLVMGQTFSIIMTGTGIVALAGIVVNNNIVLIDTYQEYERYMPRDEAIIRTAEDRIRPVLLTTITTMAGLAPMMFGLSLDFFGGGYTIDSPTALWWKQLATAVVFGLGIATVLTLVFTPSMLPRGSGSRPMPSGSGARLRPCRSAARAAPHRTGPSPAAPAASRRRSSSGTRATPGPSRPRTLPTCAPPSDAARVPRPRSRRRDGPISTRAARRARRRLVTEPRRSPCAPAPVDACNSPCVSANKHP